MAGRAGRALLADPKSQFTRAAGGDGYSLTEHLLFLIHDQLAIANWQRSGKKAGPRPTPLSPLLEPKKQTYGTKGLSDEEVEARLRAMNPRRGGG